MHSEYLYMMIIFIIVISIVIFTVNSDSCGGSEENYSNDSINRYSTTNYNRGKPSYVNTENITKAIIKCNKLGYGKDVKECIKNIISNY